jgi:hypothetical protein
MEYQEMPMQQINPEKLSSCPARPCVLPVRSMVPGAPSQLAFSGMSVRLEIASRLATALLKEGADAEVILMTALELADRLIALSEES